MNTTEAFPGNGTLSTNCSLQRTEECWVGLLIDSASLTFFGAMTIASNILYILLCRQMKELPDEDKNLLDYLKHIVGFNTNVALTVIDLGLMFILAMTDLDPITALAVRHVEYHFCQVTVLSTNIILVVKIVLIKKPGLVEDYCPRKTSKVIDFGAHTLSGFVSLAAFIHHVKHRSKLFKGAAFLAGMEASSGPPVLLYFLAGLVLAVIVTVVAETVIAARTINLRKLKLITVGFVIVVGNILLEMLLPWEFDTWHRIPANDIVGPFTGLLILAAIASPEKHKTRMEAAEQRKRMNELDSMSGRRVWMSESSISIHDNSISRDSFRSCSPKPTSPKSPVSMSLEASSSSRTDSHIVFPEGIELNYISDSIAHPNTV